MIERADGRCSETLEFASPASPLVLSRGAAVFHRAAAGLVPLPRRHPSLVPLSRHRYSLFSLSRRHRTLSSPAPLALPCCSAPPQERTRTPHPPLLIFSLPILPIPDSTVDVFWFRGVPVPPGTTCWAVAILFVKRFGCILVNFSMVLSH
mgnify:CR=1 FL=1